jgi:hypothetical protein
MNMKRTALIWIGLLGIASVLAINGFVPTTHADPTLDNGCYCHNNGIGVWFNGTGFNEFGGTFVKAGASFVLNATSKNIAATAVVPGVQQWLSNMTDNAKFTFKPQSVTDTSSLNLKHQKGNITAMYTITAPSSPGIYTVTLYAQGTMVGFSVQVTGSQTTTSTTGSSSTSQTFTNTTSNSQTSSSSSSTSTTTTTKATKAAPDVTYYSSELALIVVGFSFFVVVALWRYRQS